MMDERERNRRNTAQRQPLTVPVDAGGVQQKPPAPPQVPAPVQAPPPAPVTSMRYFGDTDLESQLSGQRYRYAPRAKLTRSSSNAVPSGAIRRSVFFFHSINSSFFMSDFLSGALSLFQLFSGNCFECAVSGLLTRSLLIVSRIHSCLF